MTARWTTPARLPGGRLRFTPPPTDRHMMGGLLVGLAAAFVALGTFATVQKRGVEVVSWQVFVLLAGLVAFWLRLLIDAVFPLGVTLAGGRLGLARWVFGRLVWVKWRPTEQVRRLVVRHHGGTSPGDLVAGGEGEPVSLAVKRVQADLTAVANELAAAMNAGREAAVTVGDENTHFTGTRADQPVFSRLEAAGETVRLPRVAVEINCPFSELQRFGPEFRRRVRWYALWAAGVALLLLYAGLGLGLIGWASAEVVFTGRTSTQVSVGGAVFPHAAPLPDLPSRLSAVAAPLLYVAVIDVPLLVLGLWLGRRLVRSVRRPAAPERVTRTVTTRLRPRPLTFTLAADAVVVTRSGRELVREGWAHLADVRAYRVVYESNNEGVSSVSIVDWLEVRLRSGGVWVFRGLEGADCEWLATRLRTAAGLPDPAPVTVG